MKKHKQLGFMLALALGSSAASATVTLHDSLFRTADVGAAVSPSTAASTFTTGSLCPTGCILGNVTLNMLIAETSTPDNITLELYSDSGAAPGSLLATLTNPTTILDSFADTIFTTQTQVALNSNSTYWLQLSGTGDGGSWGRTYATNGPGSWFHDLGFFKLEGTGNSPFIYKVEAEVSNVPLPASVWLMSTALAGLAVRGRRASA